MLLLLAPSEGKAAPAAGPPVDLDALAFPALRPQREALLDALTRLAAAPEEVGRTALGLSPGQVGALGSNGALRSAPAAPAAEVYTGVLYQHLDLASLGPAARRNANERVLVASGLWGVVGLTDRVPAYKLPMAARLAAVDGPDALPAFWRAALAAALPADALVVDLRSQAYAAAWRPARGTTVAVRVFTEADGVRKVVSHLAKATRGDVARLLVQARAVPETPAKLAGLLRRRGLTVELTRAAAGWTLDVIRAA